MSRPRKEDSDRALNVREARLKKGGQRRLDARVREVVKKAGYLACLRGASRGSDPREAWQEGWDEAAADLGRSPTERTF